MMNWKIVDEKKNDLENLILLLACTVKSLQDQLVLSSASHTKDKPDNFIKLTVGCLAESINLYLNPIKGEYKK